MTKRASTTAKVTIATAMLIKRYTETTGQGVIVRARGIEYGVVRVFDHGRCFEFSDSDDRPGTMSKNCTIRKTTIETLRRWEKRANDLYSMVLEEPRDGTSGQPSGRYIVSFDGGLVFDDYPLATPDLFLFADSTMDAETIGVWRDAGKVYVDANTSFDDVDTAERFGRQNNQLAIFDARHGLVVNI